MLNDYLGFKNIDGVYWTLQAELKFYACVFLLLITGLFTRYTWWLPLWAILTLTHLAFGEPSIMGWFISPSYSPYFISGVCFYLLLTQKASPIIHLTLLTSTLMCLYQAHQQAPGFMMMSNTFDHIYAAIAVGGFHLIFIGIALGKFQLRAYSIYPVLGGLTYPLYLIHNNAGKAIIDTASNFADPRLVTTLTSIAMLGLSYVIYRFIEPRGASALRGVLTKLFSSSRTKNAAA
jgi:peptidoglycan/LPS O-acetylase OafA/YrhL